MCESHCHHENSIGMCRHESPPEDGLCIIQGPVRCESCEWSGERDELRGWIEYTRIGDCGRGEMKRISACPWCGSTELEGK